MCKVKLYKPIFKTRFEGYEEVEANTRCLWCGSSNLKQGDGVSESFDTVKCLDCGHKTDLYEVLKEVGKCELIL